MNRKIAKLLKQIVKVTIGSQIESGEIIKNREGDKRWKKEKC